MKYIVNALTVGGKNNRIYKAGESVTSDCFYPNHAALLCEQGYLKLDMKPVEVKKIGVLTCAWKRHDLLDAFCKHFNYVFSHFDDIEFFPVVVCSSDESIKVCATNGFKTAKHKNLPLGSKWNYGAGLFKSTDIDYLVCLGSDDFISVGTMKEYINQMKKGFDMIAITDAYFFNTLDKSLVYWSGYSDGRKGQSIGLGRCLSYELLSKLDFMPWRGHLNNRLDGSMETRLRRIQYTKYFFSLKSIDGFAVDVKTDINITPFPENCEKCSTDLLTINTPILHERYL